MIVWTAVWLELPLQLSLTKDQLAEHMFFSTGFKLNLWFTLKATRAGVITTNVEYKRLFFSLFPLDVGSTGMKSATIRQHFSISMCKGCHVLCFQGRAQTTANIGMGYDTHARTDTCAHTYTHTERQGCEGRLYQTLEVGTTTARGEICAFVQHINAHADALSQHSA